MIIPKYTFFKWQQEEERFVAINMYLDLGIRKEKKKIIIKERQKYQMKSWTGNG